ncbi:MAG: 3-isopropylmalate dehydratase large subunit [Bacteroidetes bacterium]|uniref:3-isopropylmalate dehydratase large subunit n=1 Tax=Candidatus Egerieousia excrementavium TaxID=2840778 RepID=A0A9D9DJD1_9BACT|nr:3-isopropylmalate dehydratase large subunit [Candidatus Egerieousia excrementavium]
MATGKTLFDKIWDAHVVQQLENGPAQLYIDRHYIHEVTSPQAFEGLRAKGIKVFRPGRTFATCDHNVPTLNQDKPIKDDSCRIPVEVLARNCMENGIEYFPLRDPSNGIVHVIGPEQGLTLPGMCIVCGDSHTATHGAFGSIAFGIGTSEVEMVLATQTLLQNKPAQMRITINGKLGKCVTPKDVILYVISKVGTGGGTGYFVEYAGEVFEQMSMEGRMTVCNMSIEMGARGGFVAPDKTTFEYVKGRRFAPSGAEFDKAVEQWSRLYSDPDAVFDKEYVFDGADIAPMITYGTDPGRGIAIDGVIPECDESGMKGLAYMGFAPGEKMTGKKVDYIFVGSCTNGRIEDFRAFAGFVKGKRAADGITVWLVPGSVEVERKIREEGLEKILNDAGFVLRQPGCSACLAMNEDKVPAGAYSLSTSNRNFEGRQGQGARTMLCSPLVAAAAAVTGVITDPRSVE